MSKPSEQHLEENHILQAVIDVTDLSAPLRKHLAACSLCRLQKQQLEHELTRMGQLAEHFAPQQQKPVTVADKKFQWPILNWRLAFGAAAAVATVLIVVWATVLIRGQQQGSIGNLAQDMVEAEKLMTQINVLVENALPQVYLDIVGETNAQLDEDFMDFLIPAIEDSPRISALVKKGSILC